jgi:hypothetical protein
MRDRSGPTSRNRHRCDREHRPRRDDQVQRRRTRRAGRLAPIRSLVATAWKGGDPVRTPGKRDKPLRYAGLWRGRQRRKSPVRRCFKSRPPFGGVRRFASGCRFFRAVNRPLVRIPAHRHTTTGTCDLGKAEHMHAGPHIKRYFAVTPKKTKPCRRNASVARLAGRHPRPRMRPLRVVTTTTCPHARTCLRARPLAEDRR